MPRKQALNEEDPVIPDETTHCSKCDLDFATWEEFHDHKVSSRLHITCEVCSQDFKSYEAAKQHHLKSHPHEQDLRCPGCEKQFTRLGSLVCHIELTECSAISKHNFTTAVKEKVEWDKNYQQAHRSFLPGATIDNGLNPLAKPVGMSAKFEADNLISFDEPSAILNSAWDSSYSLVAVAGSENKKIPDIAPKAKIEPVLEATAAENIFGPYDPSGPDFDIMKYYIKFVQKYKCPHLGCGKSVARAPAFIQHLQSPAHKNAKLQCNSCLRYFATATALTQHSESQGVRCKSREEKDYGSRVDAFTGGMGTVDGRHADDTVKYALKGSLDPATAADAIIEANRQQAKDRAASRAEFWKLHKPKW